MTKRKLFASVLLVLAVLCTQVGSAAAAPQRQETTPITGTIQNIVIQTDAKGVTTVVVTLLDGQGATQTVNLSVEAAAALGLVTLDPGTQAPVIDETKVGQTVEIDPATVIPEDVHPIVTILADFFHVDASVVDGYHQDGFGFGVIAQAMWMSQSLEGDASVAGLILDAKRSGDYSGFTLPDGSTPSNWGQFKKALKTKDKHNLGVVVSGKADDDDDSDLNGNGKSKDKDKDKADKKDKGNKKP